MPAIPATVLGRCAATLALLLTSVALLAGPFARVASAADTVSLFTAQAELGLDGVLTVEQTATFAGAAPAELKQRFETREDIVGEREYVYTVEGFSARAGDATVTPTVATTDRYTDVTVPTNGARAVHLTYRVRGAVVSVESGTALRWRLLQGLSATVQRFAGTVAVPTAFSYVKCTAGTPNSTVPCSSATGGTEGTRVPTFTDGPRGPGEVVAVDVGFPPGAMPATETIHEEWTLGRAFSADPGPLALALGLLVLGGALVYLLHRRRGSDVTAGTAVARVGEFAPVGAGVSEFRTVDDVRPGHVGTVADERVDPIDVTSTLLDLAVRGHLLITELPRASQFASTDWELTRHAGGAGALRPFEEALLDGITAAGPVRVSELPTRVSEVIGDVQNKLYDEMVSQGWYERRPDSTRNTWTQAGLLALIAAVVITGVLAAFTSFGLVGLALIAVALGLLFVAQEMPARTQKGSALVAGLDVLRAQLLSQPTNQMPRGRELAELSKVLPYAVVLGGADRWLEAIVAADPDAEADSDELSWYHGPPNWHLRDLPASLHNFLTTVSGTLFSR